MNAPSAEILAITKYTLDVAWLAWVVFLGMSALGFAIGAVNPRTDTKWQIVRVAFADTTRYTAQPTM
jgi:hypothetical protein